MFVKFVVQLFYRATSTSNVMFAALPLSRRSSERELDPNKKRATSASGLDRQPGDGMYNYAHTNSNSIFIYLKHFIYFVLIFFCYENQTLFCTFMIFFSLVHQRNISISSQIYHCLSIYV